MRKYFSDLITTDHTSDLDNITTGRPSTPLSPFLPQDNLSVFLKGCEELGLKGSQLFDPGDLQDTSIRGNLK